MHSSSDASISDVATDAGREGGQLPLAAPWSNDRRAQKADESAVSSICKSRGFFAGVVEHICCRRDAKYHRLDPMIDLPKLPNDHAVVVRDLFRNVVVKVLEGLTLIAEGEGFLPSIDALT